VYLSSGEILGYEGLIRGPAGSPLESPQALFERAQREDRVVPLERFAARVCVKAFTQARLPGKLFLNFSATSIREIVGNEGDVRDFLGPVKLPIDRLVIDLTGQANPEPMEYLEASLRIFREAGAQFALDDFGRGNANLDLWIALQPDYVKIDRAIVDGVAKTAFRVGVLRYIQGIANTGNARLIAKGIETVDDLIVCRDIGIPCAQGYVLGRPAPKPSVRLEESALTVIHTNSIAVFPGVLKLDTGTFSASRLLINAPTVSPATGNDEVVNMLRQYSNLHAVAVVKEGKPIGLINRRTLVDAYALPYHRRLFGKKSCMEFANTSPMLVERSATIDQLAELLTNHDQRYLADGLVIVEHGQYVGLATGADLVRAITEVRIEAARHANPLTFLPGNMPIDAHIKRLVDSGASFHACYCDLNNFKPFNDQYGYWKGDEMLKLTAAVLGEACDPSKDFLGHVGGDDFLILFQSDDWEVRVRLAMERFNAGAVQLYTPGDTKAGGIQSEDRHGNLRFYGFVTIAVGVVPVGPNSNLDSAAIATLAAAAKREAKRSGDSFHVWRNDRCCVKIHRAPPLTDSHRFGGILGS
jgi:diguanylate cyclase (GGDEF)-like protein